MVLDITRGLGTHSLFFRLLYYIEIQEVALKVNVVYNKVV